MKPVRLNIGKTVCCHVCGRHTVLSDFDLHVQHCLSRRETEQAKLTDDLRTIVAYPPNLPLPTEQSSETEISTYNAAASNQYTNSLPECHKCNRHFEANRLLVHLACCRAKLPNGEATESFVRRSVSGHPTSTTPTVFSTASGTVLNGHGATTIGDGNPRLICYICGSNFPILELIEHQPTCRAAWQALQRKLNPASPLVLPPEVSVPGDPRNKHQIEAYNADAYASALQARPQCPGCSKAFILSEIELHLTVCESYRASQSASAIPDGMAVTCYTCGEDVNVANLIDHQTSCELDRSRTLHKLPSSLAPASTDPFLPTVGRPSKFSTAAQLHDYSQQARAYFETHGGVTCSVCEGTVALNDAMAHSETCAEKYAVKCYLCGIGFPAAKFEQHAQKCDHLYQQSKKRYESEFEYPAGSQDYFEFPLPTANASLEVIQTFNARALDWFESHRSVKCKRCEVHVLHDDLPFHRSKCFPPQTKKETEAAAAQAAAEEEEKKKDEIALLCYVCGREYSREGFHDHQEQCKLQFADKVKQLPTVIRESYEAQMKDEYVPQTPFPGPDADATDIAMWTEEQQLRFQSHFIKCPKCTRRFYLSRLKVHYRQCDAKSKDAAFTTPKKKKKGRTTPNTVGGTASAASVTTPTGGGAGTTAPATTGARGSRGKGSGIPGPAGGSRRARGKYAAGASSTNADGNAGRATKANPAGNGEFSALGDHGDGDGDDTGDGPSPGPVRAFPDLSDDANVLKDSSQTNVGKENAMVGADDLQKMNERFKALEMQVEERTKEISKMKADQDVILQNLSKSEAKSRELESKLAKIEGKPDPHDPKKKSKACTIL